MALVAAAKNAMLDNLATLAVFASLHTADPGASGTSEATGGSPAYARKAITWNAAAAGALDNNANPVFDVAAGTYGWIGFWSLATAGTFYGSSPLGPAGNPKVFTADVTTNAFTSPAHGYTDTQTVVVVDTEGTIPTGVVEGTIYFVRDSVADSFKLAATSGGTAIDLTASGVGLVQRITTETFAAQGTYTVSDADITLA